ncbi:MAG: hypothetical protein LBF58_04170 [Deltaproteobacteria bacterium]|nr:hypothetical protein [Deltaproteobacteria bacterium]
MSMFKKALQSAIMVAILVAPGMALAVFDRVPENLKDKLTQVNEVGDDFAMFLVRDDFKVSDQRVAELAAEIGAADFGVKRLVALLSTKGYVLTITKKDGKVETIKYPEGESFPPTFILDTNYVVSLEALYAERLGDPAAFDRKYELASLGVIGPFAGFAEGPFPNPRTGEIETRPYVSLALNAPNAPAVKVFANPVALANLKEAAQGDSIYLTGRILSVDEKEFIIGVLGQILFAISKEEAQILAPQASPAPPASPEPQASPAPPESQAPPASPEPQASPASPAPEASPEAPSEPK